MITFFSFAYELGRELYSSGIYFKKPCTDAYFKRSKTTEKLINDWIANHTNNKIQSIVKELCMDTFFVIANAIYFKGQFSEDFSNNDKMLFYGVKKDVKVDLMNIENSFNYFENEDIQSVKIPFGQGDFSLNIYLSKKKESLLMFLGHLKDAKFIETLKTKSVKFVDLKLPKFKIEYENNLVDTMEKLGMIDAFDPKNANFSRIMQDYIQFFISSINHKTTFEVNENGVQVQP